MIRHRQCGPFAAEANELDSLNQQRVIDRVVALAVIAETDFSANSVERNSTMSPLKLELPDETYRSIVATAQKLGMSAEEWVVRRLRALSLTDEERKAAKERVLKYAGCFESTGDMSQEAIDRDLAAESAATHEAT